jgi:hypothetical protein
MYAQLQDYAIAHGNVKVPFMYKENKSLGCTCVCVNVLYGIIRAPSTKKYI